MADLVVKPAYVMGPTDILTVDKFNLMATPIVELSIADRVDDQSFLRNGNFYSSFWTNGAGMTCPAGVETVNADYWSINPTAASVNSLRTLQVPDIYSLFGMEVAGNAGVTDVRVSQAINGDLSATLRRVCTFSGYIYSGAGLAISPKLEIWTADTFNGGAYTLQQTEDLQTCANGLWTYVSVSFDLTNVVNMTNGLRVTVLIPSGALSATTKNVIFSRLKLQIGELATEFVDDVGLFIQTPSVDSTMLQDGCIARPGLFLPNVVPTGAYQAKSINNGDINDGAIDGRTLLQGVTTTLTAAFTQPAVAATVPIKVTATAGFQINQPIFIIGGGAYVVSSVTDATDMVITNSGGTSNAAPAVVIPIGSSVYQAPAVIENLGYVPINKAGDSGIGPGTLQFINDDVIGASSYVNGALTLQSSAANVNNTGYMPAIGFHRPGVIGRSIGLATTGRLLAPLGGSATQYYLLDNYFKVAGADIQAGAITVANIAASVKDQLESPGVVKMFAGPGPPAGWFVCDGSAVSRTTYAALFTAIGTYWGAGDNSTTFNLPDFRGRSPLGYVSTAGSGLTGRGFASRGGEENHQLSIAELPSHDHGSVLANDSHSHGYSDPGHTHTVVNSLGALAAGAGAAGYLPSGGVQTGASATNITIAAAACNARVQAQGSYTAHNTMHPYSVLYFIVKV